MNGAVLVATGALATPPDAVTDLAMVGVNSSEVDLVWSAATGADSYDVYRSLVSGGGYEFVADTSGTTFTDSGLATAMAYYYIVVSRDDLTLLDGGQSNEVEAVPAYDLSSAWFNLQWPPSIVHTISTSTRTENIYGQIWIDGVTSAPGPTEGLMAQVGYGPDGATPDDSWNWEVMAFNADAGNNDEFVGSFLPDMLGTYDYVTRYSSDGARTWYYADLNGPGINGNPGDLEVVLSADTTPPEAPTNLMVTGTSSSSISMSWDASSEADLAGYEIYREDTAAPGYSRIASVGAGTTSFDDQTVTTGNTYNYYVLAFDTSFNRSDPSNVIEATAEPRYVSVTFTVGVPDYTPGTVYIVGDIPEFGPWNPGLVAMTQVDDSTWTHTLDILDGTQMQYKYTRGNWDTVESWGSIIVFNNRSLTIEFGSDGTQLVDNTATDWGTGPDDEKAVQYWRDPLVVDHTPADGATRVPLETTIDVVWSIPMEAGTTFDVEGAHGAVPGSFAYDGGTQTVTFTPDKPLVLGETYTVTVAGAVSVGVDGGDSGTQQVPVIFSFTTISIQDQIEDLMDEVDQLVEDGVLSPGNGRSLNAKLAAAIESLDRGDTRPAIRQLNAFINQVNALIQAGKLPPSDGHHLILEARAILAQLGQPGSSRTVRK